MKLDSLDEGFPGRPVFPCPRTNVETTISVDHFHVYSF
jgi:hypothetical protein